MADVNKFIPTENITLFRSCLVSAEYPGVESSTKYVFDKLGVEYVIDRNQSCCTGLGHYYDIFDELSTTALAARNFSHAIENDHKQYVTMCATCYAILKSACKTLNEKDEAREEINEAFKEHGLDNLVYQKNSLDATNNITHVVEVIYKLRDKLKDFQERDLSGIKIATHHGCHYCKVHADDTIGGIRNPQIMDMLCEAMGLETIGWYDHKKLTCGSGFRQRYANRELSIASTKDKLSGLLEDEVDVLLVLCPNCQLQFDRYEDIIQEDKPKKSHMVVLNITQLIALYMGADPYKVVGIQTHSVKVEKLLDKLGIEYDEGVLSE